MRFILSAVLIICGSRSLAEASGFHLFFWETQVSSPLHVSHFSSTASSGNAPAATAPGPSCESTFVHSVPDKNSPPGVTFAMSAEEFEERFPDQGTLLENEILVRMDEAGNLYGKLFYQYSKTEHRLFVNYIETTSNENVNVRGAGISTQLIKDALELNPGTQSIEASLSNVNDKVMQENLKLISAQTGKQTTPIEAVKEVPLYRSLRKLGFPTILQLQLRKIVNTDTSPLEWHLILGI